MPLFRARYAFSAAKPLCPRHHAAPVFAATLQTAITPLLLFVRDITPFSLPSTRFAAHRFMPLILLLKICSSSHDIMSASSTPPQLFHARS
jgi:hypothetical protein